MQDNESFYRWLDTRRIELNTLFSEFISKSWESMVIQEKKYSRDILKDYIFKRIAKLKRIHKQEKYEKEVYEKYQAKKSEWLQNVCNIEMIRFTKALQDFESHQNFIQSEWSTLSFDLTRERALWGPANEKNKKWRLDYTEGLNRTRKKLQTITLSNESATTMISENELHSGPSTALVSPGDKKMKQESIIEFDEGFMKTTDSENSTDDSSIESTNQKHEGSKIEDHVLSFEEDKNRKVICLLDQGDTVMDVYNVSRIEGLDACEGLLLLCRNNIYLIDNFFQQEGGEVIEIWDAPQEQRDQYLVLLSQAAGMTIEPQNGQHHCRKWGYSNLLDVFKRRFLFRDVALEIFFNDGQNAFITVDIKERDRLYTKIVSQVPIHEESGETVFSREDSGTANSTFTLSSIFGPSTLDSLTQRWRRREITNFQYLMYLNSLAGRSYNDLTQYPIFPWILADYSSVELDLTNPKTFRDLTRPMGAQTEQRRREFIERYKEWGEASDHMPAFHYGTHYSSAMIVCSFLIRLEPFTHHFLKLQGGDFDHADRLFDSVGAAWDSASEKNMGDVRELIPEFFYLPEFLSNTNKFNFGSKQETGEAIDSVVLPPWAHEDPKIFIQRHREVSKEKREKNKLLLTFNTIGLRERLC